MALGIMRSIINDIEPGDSNRIIPLPRGKYLVGPVSVLPGRLDVVVIQTSAMNDPWTNTVLLSIYFNSAEAIAVSLVATIVYSDEQPSSASFTSDRSFDVGGE